MKLVLTFGDSNTYGALPIRRINRRDRLGPAERWPGVMRAALGCELVEEGLPGRTAQFPDPVMGTWMDGREGLQMALRSHGPIDAMTLMLGTNDLKTRFGASPEKITAGIAGLLDLALGDELQTRHGGFPILLICPPAVQETGLLKAEFFGAAEKAKSLPRLYQDLAAARRIAFLNAGDVIATSDVDGIHFGQKAHRALGQAIAGAMRKLL